MNASTLPLMVEVTAVMCCGRMTPLRVTSLVAMMAEAPVRDAVAAARRLRMERALAAIPTQTASREIQTHVPFTLSRYHWDEYGCPTRSHYCRAVPQHARRWPQVRTASWRGGLGGLRKAETLQHAGTPCRAVEGVAAPSLAGKHGTPLPPPARVRVPVCRRGGGVGSPTG